MSQPSAHALFAADWLTLREPVDHASRAPELTRRAARWLGRIPEDGRRIVDLGSGRGSNLRYLAPRLPGPQQWQLLDHDAGLLAAARRACRSYRSADGRALTLDCHVTDILTGSTDALDGAVLVTASALFDLVSAAWVEQLVAACASRRAAVLFVMSVDGDVGFEQAGKSRDDAEDRYVFELLARHQRRDKGFGDALGTTAPTALADALARVGYTVHSASSAWHLDHRDAALAQALIDGWRDAAVEQAAPDKRARIHAWAARRAGAIRAGELGVRVGHRDIFAQPAS